MSLSLGDPEDATWSFRFHEWAELEKACRQVKDDHGLLVMVNPGEITEIISQVAALVLERRRAEVKK